MRLRISLLLLTSAIAMPAAAQRDLADDAVTDPFAAVPDQMQRAAPPSDPALTVLDRDMLEVRYLTEPTEIMSQIPNAVAVMTPGFGSGNFYTVRGLSDVGTYVDGIRLTKRTANHFGLLQVQEAQVRSGPAPLFGAQPAANGALNVTLRRPGTRPHGWFEGYYGEFDRLAFRGAIDAVSPDDIWGLSVEGYYQKTDGYARNLTTGDRLNDEDRHGGRLAFRVTPRENIDWNLGVAYLRDKSLNLLNFDCDDRCDDRYATTGLTVSQPAQEPIFAGLGIGGDKARRGLGNDLQTVLVTSDLVWSGNGVELRLLTGLVDQDQESAIDYADGRNAVTTPGMLPAERGLATGGRVRVADENLTEFSQDVALAFDVAEDIRLEMGASAFERDEDGAIARYIVDARGTVPVVQGLSDDAFDRNVKGRSLRAAIGYGAGSAFELKAGVRYSDEDVRLRGFDTMGYDEWSGELSARYALSQEAALFARASRAFTSAGTDGGVLTAPAPATNWTYEGGVEAGLFGGAVAARVKGFYIDAQDVRATPDFAQLDMADAVHDMTNYGAEASLMASPFRGFNISGAVGWQNAEFDDADGAPMAPATPFYAPDLTANGQISYDWYIARAESFVTPSIGFDYRDDMAVAAAPLFDTGGGMTAKSRFLMNAGISLRTDDDWWIVSVECDNCLDETYVDSAAGGYAYLGAPMTWMFRARRKF